MLLRVRAPYLVRSLNKHVILSKKFPRKYTLVGLLVLSGSNHFGADCLGRRGSGEKGLYPDSSSKIARGSTLLNYFYLTDLGQQKIRKLSLSEIVRDTELYNLMACWDRSILEGRISTPL